MYSYEKYINPGDRLKVTRPDGSIIYVNIAAMGPRTNRRTREFFVDMNLHNAEYVLDWHNCYSFGNGVESNRIRDNFNTPFMTPGVKVSTPFEDYKEEHRKYGLIYSGLYNSNSGVNNLNQFVQAEKITKDINPTYGSIQKLYTRDTDLITLCEDKVVKILSNKDAVFNADGNTQLTATENVLGQTIPFVGEYGISTNPESFVAEAYRIYFADRQRGAIVRLSRDGLTPISEHGMRNWFKENLSSSKVNLLGAENLFAGNNWTRKENTKIHGGEVVLGYYNKLAEESQDYTDHRFGTFPRLVMENVMQRGKRYRLSMEILEHGGFQREVDNTNSDVQIKKSDQAWVAKRNTNSKLTGTIVYEWDSYNEDLDISMGRTNQESGYYDGTPDSQTTTVQEYIGGLRGESSPNFSGGAQDNFYGGWVRIRNIFLEKITSTEDIKVVGSYDDNQDELNMTIVSGDPTTVTFKEQNKGWVSFKSFVPENALSCANDYFSFKDGRLWQHHVPGIGTNVFYGGDLVNTTFDVILSDAPSLVKNFYTINYEGSQAKVSGVKQIRVINNIYHNTGHPTNNINGKWFYIDPDDLESFKDMTNPNRAFGGGTVADNPVRQYRYINGEITLIREGVIVLWNIETEVESSGGTFISNPTVYIDDDGNEHSRIHGRWHRNLEGELMGTTEGLDDWQVGDIITTKQEEEVVTLFNSRPRRGWFCGQRNGIETDLERGRIHEFIEKEGKWFNYIKGGYWRTSGTRVGANVATEWGFADNNDWANENLQGIGMVTMVETIDEPIKYKTVTVEAAIANHAQTYSGGMYALFSEEEMSEMLQLPPSSWDGDVINVVQRRDGIDIATVDIIIRNNANQWSQGHGAHFRLNTGATQSDWQAGDKIYLTGSDVVQKKRIYFGNAEINRSLVVGRRLWAEKPSQRLGEEKVDIGRGSINTDGVALGNTYLGDPNGLWPNTGKTKNDISWNGLNNPPNANISLNTQQVNATLPNFGSNTFGPITGKLREGATYRLTYSIENYHYDPTMWDTATNSYVSVPGLSVVKPPYLSILKSPTSGVVTINSDRVNETVEFVANANSRVYLRGHSFIDADFKNISVREVTAGDSLGFTNIENRKIVEIGRVDEIGKDTSDRTKSVYNNYITLHKDWGGSIGDYVFYINNPIVNSSSIKGYYAKVRMENDSRGAAELFHVSSEISESSK